MAEISYFNMYYFVFGARRGLNNLTLKRKDVAIDYYNEIYKENMLFEIVFASLNILRNRTARRINYPC